MHRVTVILLCLLARASFVAAAATRVAVLAPDHSTADKIGSLLETTAPADLQWIDRRQLSALINEQQLSVCFGADATTPRVQLGRLAGADLLLLLRDKTEPTRHLEMVVFDTRSGVRLLVKPLPLTTDAEADAGVIQSNLAAAIGKLRDGISAVVAVPEFACDDLTRKFAGDGSGYAPLIEQTLLQRRGVVVVELAEARAIARESAITGRATLDRPMPFLLLGNYKNDRIDGQRVVSVRLTFKRGEDLISSASLDHVTPAKLTNALLGLTEKVVGKSLNQKQTRPDPQKDARQLYDRAVESIYVSDFSRGESLCEASLLLCDTPDAHRDAAFCLQQLCALEQNRSTGNIAFAPKAGEPDSSTLAGIALRRTTGLAHLESYMASLRLDYLGPCHTLIAGYRETCPPKEFAEMMIRVAAVKRSHGVDDDTIRYASSLRWGGISPASERYSLATQLALLTQRPPDVPFAAMAFTKDARGVQSVEMTEAMTALGRTGNPTSRAVIARIRQTIELQQSPASPDERPSPMPSTNATSVRLVPLDIGLSSVAGYAAAGEALDLAWGRVDEASDPVVYVIPRSGKIKTLCRNVAGATPIFDGQFIWTVGPKGNQIVIIDPATGEKRTIDCNDGLPDEKITAFAGTAIAPGRVCAAVAIGSMGAIRSYIALFSCGRETGAEENRPRCIVMHEEKLSSLAPGTDRFDPRLAFLPRTSARLTPARQIPQPVAAIGFTGGNGWRVITFPTVRSTVDGIGTVVTTERSLVGTDVCDGTIYQPRPPRAGRDPAAELLCCGLDRAAPQVVNRAAVFGPIAVSDHGTFIFNSATLSLYSAAHPTEPFTKFNTTVESAGVGSARNTLCPSNQFGLLLLSESRLHQFVTEARKPLW